MSEYHKSSVYRYACRGCLNKDFCKNNSVFLDDVNADWKTLFQFSVDIKLENMNISNILCGECSNKVSDYAVFKAMCHKSDLFLKSISHNVAEIKIETSALDRKFETLPVDNHTGNSAVNTLTINFERVYSECSDLENETLFRAVDETAVTNINFERVYSECSDIKNQTSLGSVDETAVTNEVVFKKTRKKINSKNDVNKSAKSKVERKIKGKSFKCEECDKKFYSKGFWLKHLKTTHVKKVDSDKSTKKTKHIPECYYCGLCDFSSSKFTLFKEHIITEHESKNDLNCKLCEFVGRDFADMIGHRYSHQESYIDANSEERVHKVSCHQCIKLRVRKLLPLQFHYRKFHLKKPGGWCTVCGQKFKGLKRYRSHENMHKYGGRYICDLCGRHFMFRRMIIEHFNDHNNIKPYICEICGQRFNRKSNLKSHISHLHTEAVRVDCHLCHKSLKREYLKKHMMYAHGDGKYECTVCSKTFTDLRFLKSHTYFHTDVRPFACTFCDKAYKSKQHLRNHITGTHSLILPVKCDHCPKKFATESQKRIHSSVHTGVRRHKCDFCERSFHTKSVYVRHLFTQHTDKDLTGHVKEVKVNKDKV